MTSIDFTEQPVAPDQPEPGRPRGSGRRRWVALAVGVVLAAAMGGVLFSALPGHVAPPGGLTDTAPGIDPASAALLQLNVTPARGAPVAPNFDLVDQHGRPTSLSQFRGKVVVWSLNDDQCTDLCALFAQDVVAADKDLGAAAKDVVFLSVNANPYYPAPSNLEAWSRQNDLHGLANWVYVTGTPAQLAATWSAYHVTVIPDEKTHTVTHDAIVEFINPSGGTQAFGYFDQGSISTAYYAHAMAQMAADLLPSDERTRVGGTAVTASATKGATVGDRAPSFALRSLASGVTTSLGDLDTQPLVVNFWASTCSVCIKEMPALQQISADFGAKVDVVGIDVADPRTAAASFAQKLGVRYRLLADPGGTTAAAYRVDALPVTFIVAPGGMIEARHDGALTAPELAAVLDMDFAQLPQVAG